MRPVVMDDTLICPVCYALVFCPRNNVSYGHVHLRHHIRTGEIESFSWDGIGTPIRLVYPEPPTEKQLEYRRKLEIKASKYEVPGGIYRLCGTCNFKQNVTRTGKFRRHAHPGHGACDGSGLLAPDIEEYKLHDYNDRGEDSGAEAAEDLRGEDEGLAGEADYLPAAGS